MVRWVCVEDVSRGEEETGEVGGRTADGSRLPSYITCTHASIEGIEWAGVGAQMHRIRDTRQGHDSSLCSVRLHHLCQWTEFVLSVVHSMPILTPQSRELLCRCAAVRRDDAIPWDQIVGVLTSSTASE